MPWGRSVQLRALLVKKWRTLEAGALPMLPTALSAHWSYIIASVLFGKHPPAQLDPSCSNHEELMYVPPCCPIFLTKPRLRSDLRPLEPRSSRQSVRSNLARSERGTTYTNLRLFIAPKRRCKFCLRPQCPFFLPRATLYRRWRYCCCRIIDFTPDLQRFPVQLL